MNKTYLVYGLLAFAIIGVLVWLYTITFPSKKKPQKEKKMSRKDKRELKRLLHIAQLQTNRDRSIQQIRFDKFKEDLKSAIEQAKIHQKSVLTFTKAVLELVEDAMIEYENSCQKKHLIEMYMPNYYHVVMLLGCQAIIDYSGRKGLTALGTDLMTFVETNFRIRGLSSVLFRHRAHIHYAERMECMSVAILEYFAKPISQTVMNSCTVPFDLAKEDEDLMSWDSVHSEFYRKAIDDYFTGAIKGVERVNYVAQTRRDNIEHQKNRRQRSARVKKQNRKSRKMGYV